MAPSPSPSSSCPATMTPPSRMEQTYENALLLLEKLKGNSAIRGEFSKKPQGQRQQQEQPQPLPDRAAINERSRALVLDDLARAGYAPGDLVAAGLRCVHVAGTKGKGSVSAFVTGILTQSGLTLADAGTGVEGSSGIPVRVGRVGTYMSPHLVSPRERIMLDGRLISRELFTRYIFELWARMSAAAAARHVEQVKKEEAKGKDEVAAAADADPEGWGFETPANKPFFFGFLTMLALHVFVREGVRSAVVECGIGGEYDTTNVLPAAAVSVSAVAQLGIDHVEMLGETVAEIAWHKAGIFKPGVPAYALPAPSAGEDDERAMQVLESRARERGVAPGGRLHKIDVAAVERWGGVPGASLVGPFQKYNMALAASVAREHLRRLRAEDSAAAPAAHPQKAMEGEEEGEKDMGPISYADLSEKFLAGLRTASLPGRCQKAVDSSSPSITWWLDGAHTRESIIFVGEWFAPALDGSRVERRGEENTDTMGQRRPRRRGLIFNQPERDAAALLRTLLQSIESHRDRSGTTTTTPTRDSPFDFAVFCRNEEDKAPPAATGAGEEGSGGSSRDLTIQRACAGAMRELAPATAVEVFDNVRSAVEYVRSRAAEAGAGGGATTSDGGQLDVLVTGSLYLVGGVLKICDSDESKL